MRFLVVVIYTLVLRVYSEDNMLYQGRKRIISEQVIAVEYL